MNNKFCATCMCRQMQQHGRFNGVENLNRAVTAFHARGDSLSRRRSQSMPEARMLAPDKP